MTKSTKVELKAKAKLVAKPIAKPACKGGKPFPCKDCPKSYESIASRAKHWNNNHAHDYDYDHPPAMPSVGVSVADGHRNVERCVQPAAQLYKQRVPDGSGLGDEQPGVCSSNNLQQHRGHADGRHDHVGPGLHERL